MKINFVYCAIVATCLIGTTAAFDRIPNWVDYEIPKHRADVLTPLYAQYNGSDEMTRQLMREADQSSYLIAEYIALAEFLNKYDAGYSSSAIILAGNARRYVLENRIHFQNLAVALDMLPKSVQKFPVDMEQFLINLKHEQYLIKPYDNYILVAESRDNVDFIHDTVKWEFKFDPDTYSYMIQKFGEKWYVDDAGMVKLVGEDTPTDGYDQWQFVPVQVDNFSEDTEQPLRYRIINELRNGCVCQVDDTGESGNLMLQESCDIDSCIWEIEGALYTLLDVPDVPDELPEGNDFFRLF